MSVTEIPVQRFSLTCSKSFEQVVSEFEAVISRPNMAVFLREIADAKSYAELEQVVENALGPSGLMEFIRFDIGEALVRSVYRAIALGIIRGGTEHDGLMSVNGEGFPGVQGRD